MKIEASVIERVTERIASVNTTQEIKLISNNLVFETRYGR